MYCYVRWRRFTWWQENKTFRQTCLEICFHFFFRSTCFSTRWFVNENRALERDRSSVHLIRWSPASGAVGVVLRNIIWLSNTPRLLNRLGNESYLAWVCLLINLLWFSVHIHKKKKTADENRGRLDQETGVCHLCQTIRPASRKAFSKTQSPLQKESHLFKLKTRQRIGSVWLTLGRSKYPSADRVVKDFNLQDSAIVAFVVVK